MGRTAKIIGLLWCASTGNAIGLTLLMIRSDARTTSMKLAGAARTVVDGATSGTYGVPENWTGVYHMTCTGSTSWFGFASAIFEGIPDAEKGRGIRLNPIPTEGYPRPAKRPRNSVLSNEKLHLRFGVQLSPWLRAFQQTIEQLGHAES